MSHQNQDPPVDAVDNAGNGSNETIPPSVQKRLDELTREKYQERRERLAAESLAQQLTQELQALKGRLQAVAGQQPPPAPVTPPVDGPNPDHYPAGRYDPDYLEALTEHKAQKIIEHHQQAAKMQALQQKVLTSEAKASADYPDFATVRAAFFAHPLAALPQLKSLILDCDDPAQMAYFLGKNPEEMQQLGELEPLQAARYLGALETRLSASTPARKVATNTSKPITPLGSAKASAVTNPADARSMSEYAQLRAAQMKRS